MTFGGSLFFVFLAAVLVLHRAVPGPWRTPVLLVASITFYAATSPPHALVLIALTAFVWWTAERMTYTGDRRWLVVGIAAILISLASFKYVEMIAGTIDAVVGHAWRLPVPRVVAPLGLSFVSFMLIGYLVEVHRGAHRASLRDLLTFSTFFPTIVSGPIKRWGPFHAQLAEQTAATREDLAAGAGRIVIGMFKKLVIADTLALALGPIASPAGTRPVTMLVTVYLLALRIYFDFAGYSDMAIGVARMLGFRVPENFDHPYLRRNLSEFWRHWHMSLTSFLTEYVYIPLGGSRRGEVRTALNSLAVMGLSGLWHGAGWHFVAWGLYHGIGLVLLRWLRLAEKALHSRIPRLAALSRNRVWSILAYGFGTVVTFHFVALGWVLFSAPLGRAFAIYSILWDGVERAAQLALAVVGA